MAKNIHLVGISGTNGSGKDTLGHILAEYHNYLFISVTELLRDECKKRGIKVSRENLRMVSAEWRREFGLAVLIDKAVSKYNTVKGKYSGLAVASLRNPGEADRVHELNGIVVWLDADPKVRYDRVRRSSDHRIHRKHEDDKTFEEFIAEEEAEMHKSGDEATLDMSAVKDRADVLIDNSQDNTSNESIADFKAQVEKVLGLVPS